MSQRIALIEGFQETIDFRQHPGQPVFKQDFRSRVLVAVTKVIAVDFTLTKANLERFERKFSAGMDKLERNQTIGQDRSCTICKLLARGSLDERAVLDRAEKKAIFIHHEQSRWRCLPVL